MRERGVGASRPGTETFAQIFYGRGHSPPRALLLRCPARLRKRFLSVRPCVCVIHAVYLTAVRSGQGLCSSTVPTVPEGCRSTS